MSLSTPLAKARGLGSAKSGTHHWIAQRLTAIALIPLSIWFVSSLVCMTELNHQTATAWIQSPLVAIFLILFIIAMFHHAQLGLQVVIEDYIDSRVMKITGLILLKLVSFFAGLAAAIAVLKIYLGS
ncbi:MAG: succinate dehydrogenase, hydrophobic membrane anchor protein [Gammaproteobacteria bacterium]|nr:MAG: succinate dehydrogenase, hydrophobic membrane anchor protein [Gammaproteobacteria bacterium]RKZ71325.1 MAG: succinate dehydrogenase, hydrophobic membrane anchor protein [Gammaproteobacteria bacterium]